jgi:hypothetical protein
VKRSPTEERMKKNILVHENGQMKPIETVPGMGERKQRRMKKGVNSTMIFY